MELLAYIAFPLLMAGTFGSLAALVVRFRRSRGTEREQLKWLTYGGVIAILGLTLMSAWAAARPGDVVVEELAIGGV
jgi:hypothetical protein